jgi:hypothetical protein
MPLFLPVALSPPVSPVALESDIGDAAEALMSNTGYEREERHITRDGGKI